MEDYKTQFIRFMVQCRVLTFGDFTTKSGRKTPYFINTGRYRTGGQMSELARYYVDAIVANGFEFDLLFGPAYKGIPLVVACSIELARRGRDVPFCFNRKEAKEHGEGGLLVGQIPVSGDRVLIIEDVTTAGTSIRETMPLLQASADVCPAGLIVSVDRRERGGDDVTGSALEQIGDEFGMSTAAIVDVDEIIEALRVPGIDGEVVISDELHERMIAYRKKYGA